MELEILTSKKGTKVVRATDLHQALQLTDHHYAVNIRRWLQDVYQFSDGIRRPESHRDYARRKEREANLLEDYFLSVELAKLIALNSRSRVKQKWANVLWKAEQQQQTLALLSSDEVRSTLELVKAMSYMSCQAAAEAYHLSLYQERNDGSADFWWHYRTQLLGYKKEDIRRKLRQRVSDKVCMRDLLLKADPHELIRTAVIDHFISQGKSPDYARQMGDLAKYLAHEMKVEIVDDRTDGNLFAPPVDPDTIRRIKGQQRVAAA